jgi:hypothetical protein
MKARYVNYLHTGTAFFLHGFTQYIMQITFLENVAVLSTCEILITGRRAPKFKPPWAPTGLFAFHLPFSTISLWCFREP